ncbi:cache domain-containing sensor histidine kinase [Cohnella rhizosphaerae]|uniref:histidine kinase n=1 Tax=Cohnella rhizosphaerae TaxID=1457232 RepID=A0A9X4QV22_9BACL|nr:sensor histidine kinase [Cohnella rhizosphaerae]MDG0811978.1 sensor histidine kinase [Cohnella rhizosphaerae]
MWQLNIRHKLTLFVTGFSLLCYFMTCSLFYSVYANAIKQNAYDTSRSQVASIGGNLDSFFARLSEGTKLIAEDPQITDLLGEYARTGGSSGSGAAVERALNEFAVKMNKEVEYAQIVPAGAGSDLKFSTGYEFSRAGFDWSRAAWEERDPLSGWIMSGSGAAKPVYLRQIREQTAGPTLGVVAVFLRESVWPSFVQGNQVNLRLATLTGRLVYGTGEAAPAAAQLDPDSTLFREASTLDVRRIGGDAYIVSSQRTANGLFVLVSLTSMHALLNEISQVGILIVMVGLLSFFLTFLFSLFVSGRLTASLDEVRRQIGDLTTGRLPDGQAFSGSRLAGSRGLSGKVRVTLIYASIVILPMVLSILIMNEQAGKSIRSQTLSHHQNQLKFTARRIDAELDSYDQKLQYLFGEKSLNAAAARYASGAIGAEEWARTAERTAMRLEAVASGTLSVAVYDADRKLIYSKGCAPSFAGGMLQRLEDNPSNRTLWFPSAPACGSYYAAYGKRLVALTNYDGVGFFDSIGFVVLSFNEQLLQNLYDPRPEETSTALYLTDKAGTVLSHPWKSRIGAESPYGDAPSEKKAGRITLTEPLSASDWLLAERIPNGLLNAQTPKNSLLLWGSMLADFLAISAGIYAFLRYLMRGIRQLNQGMEQVAGGNLSVRANIRSRDEVRQLADGFNDMVRRLNELMAETYMQGIRRKEAELNSLQAQINPHFLYNTLESINWEAMMMTGGPNKVSEMVTALSDLLRLSISKGKEIVWFQDEIDHVKNYLILQKERYSDKFEVEWQIDERLYRYRTLKLILQPLVENAIYHGLELKEGPGVISIKGKLADGGLELEIADNGLGMDEAQLEAVRSSIEEQRPSQPAGIGIRNVHERIRLYYGESYGIEVFSAKNAGTTIVIRLPIHEDGDAYGAPPFFEAEGS